jgi:hypothetical protein
MKKTNSIILIIITAIITSIACCCIFAILIPYIQSLPKNLLENQSIFAQSTDTNLPSAIIGKVGDTLSQGNYVIELVGVEKTNCIDGYPTSCAAKGEVYISVEIIITSAGDGVNVNPFSCMIKDSQGYKYMIDYLGKGPSLQAQNNLPIGEKSRGWIAFVLPETATGLIFSYEPIELPDENNIRFDLGI